MRSRYCRAGGRPLARLGPAGNGFVDEPRFGVMLREELGLDVHQLGGMGLERFGDLRVRLLAGIAKQPAVLPKLDWATHGIAGRELAHRVDGDDGALGLS